MDRDTLYELRSMLALYPYFQTARLLMLQNLYLLHDQSFDQELRQAAIYITDRRVLFQMIEAAHYQLKPRQLSASGSYPAAGSASDSSSESSVPGSSSYSSVPVSSSGSSAPGSSSGSLPGSSSGSSVVGSSSGLSVPGSSSGSLPGSSSGSLPGSSSGSLPGSSSGSSVVGGFPADKDSRTLSLIDDFLDSLPKEDEKEGKKEKRKPTPADAAVDYVAYLLESESDEEREQVANVPQLIGQSLIDSFINNDKGKITLNENPTLRPDVTNNASETKKEGEQGYYTETLARIYIKQGNYSKALEIIRQLSLDNPKKNVYFADQIRFLEKLIINNNKK